MTKILLVEDDKSLREIYGVRLLAEGYDIVSAGDGEEALAMAIKEKPSLIVSDVMMPKISGFDMLDILRSTTETRDIRVIMMTALSSEDQRLRGEQLGADRYLVKSQVGIEDVVRTVHEVLGDIPTAAPAAPFTQQQPQPTQQTAPAPAPAPQLQAAPAPQAPQPPTAPEQQNSLPQPTAPFSSQRPANLGDRVIHPIGPDDNKPQDVASLIAQELSQHDSASEPQQQQPQDVSPAPTQQPDQQQAQPEQTTSEPQLRMPTPDSNEPAAQPHDERQGAPSLAPPPERPGQPETPHLTLPPTPPRPPVSDTPSAPPSNDGLGRTFGPSEHTQ